VSRSLKACPPPSFVWSGDDPDDAVGEINEDYIEEFKEVNAVAAVAYIVAAVEWIYWYVRDRVSPGDAHDYEAYIAAHWVWLCTLPRRVPPPEFEPAEYAEGESSVHQDAVEFGFRSFVNGIMSVREHSSAVDAAFVTQLAEYIFPRQCGFSQWKEAVVGRLKKRFPAEGTHYDKVRVPRQIFETDVDVESIDSDGACDELILDVGSVPENRFLPLRPAE
jgi:hypothetical protein